jgi:hypothetical protein
VVLFEVAAAGAKPLVDAGAANGLPGVEGLVDSVKGLAVAEEERLSGEEGSLAGAKGHVG